MTPAQFRAIRDRTGHTQASLGAVLGMSQDHIGKLERGERGITHVTAAWMRLLDDDRALAERYLTLEGL